MMKFVIELLFPVHIGSGEILSPYCDYIYQNEVVHYIDHLRLEKDIFSRNNSEELINEFIQIIREQAGGNSSNRYQLQDFFKKNNLDIDNYTLTKIEASEVIKEEINRMVHTAAGPIIPGSSIKGAIRTALLYDNLRVNGYDINKMKGDYIGQDKFGVFSNDLLKHLYVSDSQPFSTEQVQVYRTNRIDLNSGEKTINIIREALVPGSRSRFQLQTKAIKDYNLINDSFYYLYEGGEEFILEKINRFYLDSINRERNELERANNPELAPILDKYTLLLNNLQQIMKDNKCAILRIGAGKTFFENTIASLFTQEDLDKVIEKKDRPFPKTRSIVIKEGITQDVMGWIKIIRV